MCTVVTRGYLSHHVHYGDGQFEDERVDVGVAKVNGGVNIVAARSWLRLPHQDVLLIEVPVNGTPER